MIKRFRKTLLTGGSSAALDGISGLILNEGDICSVYLNDTEKLYFYRLDSDSDADEDSPNIISPDSTPGSKRWILQNIVCKDFTLGDIATIGNYDNLSVAIDTTSTMILVINEEVTLTSNITVPNNIILWFTRSGIINLGNYNLTINGTLDAQLHQIFNYTGTGTVSFGPGSINEVYPQWWGALGDYDHNDTNAIQYAFDSFSSIFIPAGRYKVSSLAVYDYKTIDGVRSNDIYSGEPTTGTVLKCYDNTQSDPIIDCDDSIVSNCKVTILNIAIVGATTSVVGHDCIKSSGAYLNVENCNLSGGRNGINVNYNGVSKIDGCTIHENHFGISAFIDTRITNCFIAGNLSHGLNMQNSNDSQITNNKIEWNGNGTSGCNIEINAANNCVVADNIIDHAGSFGLHTYDCTRITVTGNFFKGNGHDVAGDYDYDYHVRFSSTDNIVFVGNMTKLNPYGDGLTPKRSIRITDCNNILISNNDLSGTLDGLENIVDDGDNTNVRLYLNTPFTPNRVSGYSHNMGRELITVGIDSTAVLPAIKVVSLNTWEVGRLYQIDCIARDSNVSGFRWYASLFFTVLRDAGDAFVEYGFVQQLDTKVLKFGWDTDPTDLEFVVETNSDGSEIYITIYNSSGTVIYQLDVTVKM